MIYVQYKDISYQDGSPFSPKVTIFKDIFSSPPFLNPPRKTRPRRGRRAVPWKPAPRTTARINKKLPKYRPLPDSDSDREVSHDERPRQLTEVYQGRIQAIMEDKILEAMTKIRMDPNEMEIKFEGEKKMTVTFKE